MIRFTGLTLTRGDLGESDETVPVVAEVDKGAITHIYCVKRPAPPMERNMP